MKERLEKYFPPIELMTNLDTITQTLKFIKENRGISWIAINDGIAKKISLISLELHTTMLQIEQLKSQGENNIEPREILLDRQFDKELSNQEINEEEILISLYFTEFLNSVISQDKFLFSLLKDKIVVWLVD